MEIETTKKREITDEEALAVATSVYTDSSSKRATRFVPRTILYPVELEYKPGVKTTEIRTFVRQREFVSEHRWEAALEVEKKYAKLNKEYHDSLVRKGIEVNVKEPKNLLRGTPLGITK